jgi:Glycosyltransferase
MSKLGLHIVISAKSYLPVLGGSVVYASMLAEAFARQGCKVTVITRTLGPPISGEYLLMRQPSLGAKLNLAAETDILMQIESSWSDAWPFLFRKIPWICTIHRGTMPIKGISIGARIRLILERLAYRCAYTIGVSHYVSKVWRLDSGAIPNPYDDRVFFPPPQEETRDVDVLFVGRMTKDKGVLVLIDALKQLLQEGQRIRRVAFIGHGPLEPDLRICMADFHGEIETIFPGRLEPEKVADWMRRSRILAFPTTPEWEEASPLTPLEAAACGCLVVAANSGGTIENVSPDHWVVQSGSATNLASGISQALARPVGPITARTAALLAERQVDKVATVYLERFQSLAKN